MNIPKFFIKLFKNSIKLINSLLEKNLNKLKINNLKKLLFNNKIFLTIVAAIILFFSYVSFPNIYNQDEISAELKKKLLNKLNLEFNFSKNLEYKFLPRPHFIINESSIIFNENKISQIEKIKIYVSLENLFSLKNMKVKDIKIEEGNFNLNKKNYNFFIKLLDSNFKDTKLEIINSNIFYRNLENDVLFINNILNAKYIYDLNESKNILYSNNEIFNLPYSIKLLKNEEEKKLYSKINIDSLRLQVENQFSYGEDFFSGLSEFNFLNMRSVAEYKTDKNLFEFKLFDKTQKSKFSYNGKFNFKPFHSYLRGSTLQINLSHLFFTNGFVHQLLKTEILNNKNVDFKLSINANKIKNFHDFINIFIKLKIQEGLIDLDQTKFSWKNYVNFNLVDSLIYTKDGKLILDAHSEINITNLNEVYKFLVTPKNIRKKINKININFTYLFDEKIINIKNIKVDGKFDNKLNNYLNDIFVKENNLQNKIYFKNLLNNAFKNYAG